MKLKGITKPRSILTQANPHHIDLALILMVEEKNTSEALQKRILLASVFSVLLCAIRAQKGKNVIQSQDSNRSSTRDSLVVGVIKDLKIIMEKC